MSGMHQQTFDVLRHVKVHGSRTRAEVIKAFPNVQGAGAGKIVDNLAMLGYLTQDGMSTPATYIVTKKGRDKIAAPFKPAKPRSASQRAKDHVEQLQRISSALAGRAPATASQLATATRQRAAAWQPKPWDYQPTEYAPSARRGAMAAFSLPTRIGNSLHYRDGRVTDLDGNPIE
jgi:predicted transcriptional regulator